MTAPTSELVAALAAAAAEFDPLLCDASNPHYGSRYATLGALIAATRPALSRHGLALVQTVDVTDTSAHLVTRLHHTSGESLESQFPLPAWKGPQEFGSLLTYVRRYAGAAMLNVASEVDDDANAAQVAAPGSDRPKYRGTFPKSQKSRTAAATSGVQADALAADLADAIDDAATDARLEELVAPLNTLPASLRPPLRKRFAERRAQLRELERDRTDLDGATNRIEDMP